jgi:predicted P-loop ATPase
VLFLELTKKRQESHLLLPCLVQNVLNFNMNSILAFPGDNRNKPFVIGKYLKYLIPSETRKGYYHCPACKEPKLSIDKVGLQYTCYACYENNQIAYKLRELNGEFAKKPDTIPDTRNRSKAQTEQDKAKAETGEKTGSATKLKGNTAVLETLTDIWGSRLSFDLRSNEILLDGKALSLDTASVKLAKEFRIDCPDGILQKTLISLAEENSFDPVKNKLAEWRKGEGLDVDETNIAALFFKIKDPLLNAMVWKFLLAAVARVYNPGCKFDNALILQGKQGIGKSTFLKLLSGGFFSDSMGNKLERDDVQIMNQHWFNELPEFEVMTGRHYAGTIKAFLSRTTDDVILKYEKSVRKLPRRSVICGSVNEGQFMTDLTGNRRLWVIPVEWIIPPEELEVLMPMVWKTVIDAYHAGFPDLELSAEHRKQQAEANEQYLHSDPVMDEIAGYLGTQKRLYVTINEILLHLQDSRVDWGIKGSDRSAQMRIAKILSNLGWNGKQSWVNGRKVRAWFPPTQPDLNG